MKYILLVVSVMFVSCQNNSKFEEYNNKFYSYLDSSKQAGDSCRQYIAMGSKYYSEATHWLWKQRFYIDMMEHYNSLCKIESKSH